MGLLVAAVPSGVPELAALLIIAAVLSFVLYYVSNQGAAAAERRRTQAFVKSVGTQAAAPGDLSRPFRERVVQPVLQALAGPLLRLTPQSVLQQTQDLLAHAGDPLGIGAVELLGVRLALAVVGFVGATFLALTNGDWPQALRILAPAIGAFIGYAIPGVLVQTAVSSRQRLIRRALPQTLEVLAISAEAGLAFDGAVAHVAQRFQGPLSDELRRVFLEFQMGRTRRQALNDFSRRIGLQEIDRFVQSLQQAEAMGAPISKVLQDQAQELRTSMRHRAEESARTAPIKMMFPLVLFILPALFLIILGPTIATVISGGIGGF
jgi:tight adherence protein C